MLGRLAVRACIVAGALSGAAACTAISGANELGIAGSSPEDRVDGGSAADGSSNGGEGGLAADGAVVGEGGPPPGPPIDPSLAACGEGSICLTNASGWTPVVSMLAAQGCPATWPTRTVYQTSGGGGCDCDCAPASGSCGGQISTRGGPACTGAPTTQSILGDASCTSLPGVALPVAFMAQPTNAPTSCTGTAAARLGAPRPASVCSGATLAASDACKSDEACVPKTGFPQGAINCVAHDGDIACPAKLPIRTVVGASVTDGRSCGNTCTCDTNGCAGGKLQAFTNADCTSSIRTVDVDGSCTTSGQSLANATAYRYTASTGCKVKQPPAMMGTETVASPRTLCCSFGF
jgi:hypothetical protein